MRKVSILTACVLLLLSLLTVTKGSGSETCIQYTIADSVTSSGPWLGTFQSCSGEYPSVSDCSNCSVTDTPCFATTGSIVKEGCYNFLDVVHWGAFGQFYDSFDTNDYYQNSLFLSVRVGGDGNNPTDLAFFLSSNCSDTSSSSGSSFTWSSYEDIGGLHNSEVTLLPVEDWIVLIIGMYHMDDFDGGIGVAKFTNTSAHETAPLFPPNLDPTPCSHPYSLLACALVDDHWLTNPTIFQAATSTFVFDDYGTSDAEVFGSNGCGLDATQYDTSNITIAQQTLCDIDIFTVGDTVISSECCDWGGVYYTTSEGSGLYFPESYAPPVFINEITVSFSEIDTGDDLFTVTGVSGCSYWLCAEDEYVSSNVCTACAAGSTNAAGDDATGSDTTCTASSCGALTVANSDQAGGSTVGTTTDTASVICDDGYSGSGTATCTADSNATTATWTTVTCTASSCGALIVANSSETGSTVGTTTDTIFVICDDGYSGSGNATCTADLGATTATWTSTVTCTENVISGVALILPEVLALASILLAQLL